MTIPSGASAAAPAQTLAIGHTGWSLRGVAGDGDRTYALTADVASAHARLEARAGATVAWGVDVPGSGGPIARTGSLVIAGTAVIGSDVRGEPGSLAIAIDAATGAPRWRVSFGASGWAVITAIAPAPDGGCAVAGTFTGTLRAIGASGGAGASKLVSSAGRTDGFVARLTPAGELAWVIRVGGPYADTVQGVAVTADRVAIAGTVATGAELGGVPLPALSDRSPYGDGFVAELDANGARLWSQTFGGKLDDAVAGVAIDNAGRVVVAASARDVVHLGPDLSAAAGGSGDDDDSAGDGGGSATGSADQPSQLSLDRTARGPADGLVAWWSPAGVLLAATTLGGNDFDGLRAITAVGERVVVGGFFSGQMSLGGRDFTAGGGDDAFLAELDAGGHVVASWPVGGDGREEIAALASVPGGFVAGVTYTARARVGDAELAAPEDPTSGAAVVIRAAR